MTEVDTVMHEGGTPVPGCSPDRQTTTTSNNNAIVDSSLNDTEADHDDTVAASNNENGDNNKITTNTSKTTTATPTNATAVTTIITTSSTTTTMAAAFNSNQQAKTEIKKPNEAKDVDNNAIYGGNKDNNVDRNIFDVTTTTIESEDGEDDSQVTSSSTDIDGKPEKEACAGDNVGDKEANATPQSMATIDDDDEEEDEENSNSQKSTVEATTKTANNRSKTPADGAGENSQSCDKFSNNNDDSSQQSIEKEKLHNNESKIEQKSSSAEDDAIECLKSTEGDISPSFESAKVASPVAANKSEELLHDPMEVDGVADSGDADNEADPLGGAGHDATSVFENTKNEAASNAEKTSATNNIADNNGSGSIVELDDTEDDENEDEDMNSNTSQSAKQHSNGNENSKTMCIDSDDPVVIGSDSENETPTTTTKPISVVATSSSASNAAKVSNKKVNAPSTTTNKTASHVIDDDDDDCVVVEDESSPMELTAGGINSSEQVKRKSMAIDADLNSDDSQPPSKRQRSGAPTTAPINQLTIKDARSLTPSDLSSNARKNMANDAPVAGNIVYPVNITPAGSNTNTNIGPPKLAPLGGGTGTVGAINVMPGLTNLSTNANLLPGLTDDMFVLEAPSFIVPYIYEKPPGDSLKGIVKEIENKYELTKEDLTEADKSDEFDMMTEQNKGDREQAAAAEQIAKKKKKRRGGNDVDDSWSEESDEDDDDDEDDDSDAGVRTKVLIKEASDDLTALKGAIKPASAVVQSSATPTTAGGVASTKPGQENYFESPLGKFFMDIGVGLVQEFVQSDLIRLQKRKMKKTLGQNTVDFERAITALTANLEASKKKNSPYKFTMKRCEFCNFKSESALSMANHYETPHMNGPLYKCNFCTFEIRNATEIVYHMEAMHNIKARLIKPLPYHQCPNCGFEDNGKAKLARHQPVCAKKFRPEVNLAPPNDWEAPAKIPRIKPRHGLVGTATAYQAMAAQAAAQKAALATIQQQQQQAQARNIQAAALAAQNAAKIRGRAPTLPKTTGSPNGTASLLRGQNPVGPRAMATNVVLPNNYQMPGGNQLLQQASALAGKKTTLPGQPSISITPLPRQGASLQTPAPSTSKMPPAGMKPGKSPSNAGNSKAQFVICEICDGYIKDLEQLRNHMQWMHEVKIHPKMIYNRPPLNCQKCQFRFFTDQGLERHLLGSHGLVTSSMQEAANNGKDAGRCPVCGRMYQWKLLNHVARDHHMTLKPAHLSYKCTVCTATFGMYKQFETHVYTAHSTVAKKAMDGKKNNAASGGASTNSAMNSAVGASSATSSSSNQQRVAANDALLKPLKINDEITIIPQPASKPRITNMESHVID